MRTLFKPEFPYLRVGLLWLRVTNRFPIRRFFAGGPLAIYHREVTRKQILKSVPVETADSGIAEIHLLTGAADWLNGIWALKSFYQVSEVKFPLVVHDDGSLSTKARAALSSHFPGARVISRAEADADIGALLAKHPRCWSFRQTNYLAQKVFDLEYYLKSPRMLLFDSDLLFFHRPHALMEKLMDPYYRLNSVNRNWDNYGYALSQAAMRERHNVDVCDAFNSGLGVIHKGVMHVDWIEKWLSDEELRTGHHHRIEQTLIAMCCCKSGCELLPSEYDVYAGPTDYSKPVRHYIRPVRPLMYKEGMSFLSRHRRAGGAVPSGNC